MQVRAGVCSFYLSIDKFSVVAQWEAYSAFDQVRRARFDATLYFLHSLVQLMAICIEHPSLCKQEALVYALKTYSHSLFGAPVSFTRAHNDIL